MCIKYDVLPTNRLFLSRVLSFSSSLNKPNLKKNMLKTTFFIIINYNQDVYFLVPSNFDKIRGENANLINCLSLREDIYHQERMRIF